MKKIRFCLFFSLCTIFAVCFAFSAGAAEIIESGNCGADGDNLTWTLTDDGVLEINGTGNMKNYRSSSSPWYSYRDIIINVVISDSITSIGRYAFENCTNIEKVYITSIEAWMRIAFFHSYSNPLYYNADLYLNEKRITELVIPDTVTSICDYAFSGYNNLTSVTIPNSVTSIGYFAFNGCTSIEKVYISSIEGWMNISFESYSNPLNNGANLYFNDKKLTELVIPDSITTVNSYAFSGCNSLTSVTIPDNVTIINVGAFSNCTNLTNVTIHDTITTINDGAFYGCNSIEKVYINSIEAWVNIDFHGASSNPLFYGADLYLNGEKLINLTIPSTQTDIKDYSFYGCKSLKTITVPESVTTIPESAFKDCTNATIYGYANTCAETTARANILPFVALDEGWQPKLKHSGKCGDNLMWQLYQDGRLVLGYMNNVTSDAIYDYTTSSSPTWNTYATLVRTVDFPKGITRVGDYAFDKLTGIVTVNYSGNEESWKEIEIGSNNAPFEKAYILYGESMNVNINYKDVLKTTATVNGKVIPVIINLEAGTTWKELKANLIYSDYTDVIVYNHDGKLIELDDALSTGFVLHHINKDGAIIEELLISVSGDVTGDSIVNAEDLQNVVAHLAGEDNNLNKIAIDKNLDDILTMQELNSFISTFR